MWFVDYDERLKAMSEHPSLLALLKRLMGAAPELFQDMALIKPPRIGREKPWHQDVAYFDVPANTHVIGVWIALDDVTPENGCMHILPGGHLTGPRLHFKRRDWQICDADMLGQIVLAAPLPPGGCLLFHGLLPHGTPPNRSPHRRRALQFHYRPVGTPAVADEERLAVFGGEGKNVTC
jgi:phytanoyl-CoA hydroxylase